MALRRHFRDYFRDYFRKYFFFWLIGLTIEWSVVGVFCRDVVVVVVVVAAAVPSPPFYCALKVRCKNPAGVAPLPLPLPPVSAGLYFRSLMPVFCILVHGSVFDCFRAIITLPVVVAAFALLPPPAPPPSIFFVAKVRCEQVATED